MVRVHKACPYSGLMAVTLANLLASRSLHLRVAGHASGNPDAVVTWVATTELEDPLPFLSGGEVVLTTGLRQKSAAAQRRFITRVHEAGVVAVGFALGLSHSKIPPAVLAEADRLDLPVFEVPYETPFVAISRMVADAISADHYGKLEQLLKDHQALASALLGGGGLPALLRTLATTLRTDVVLSQYGTRVFASSNKQHASWHTVPISTGMKDRCTMALAEPFERNAIVDYAQSLISLELNNQAKHRERERRATGQILQDVVRGTLQGQDATLRLDNIGVDTSLRQQLIVVQASANHRRALRTLPLPAGMEGTITGLLDDRLVLILQDAESAEESGRRLSDYFREAGLSATVGVGGGYAQANGLRWSYFEAKEALSHGRPLNVPQRLSLTSLLLASEDVPLADLASEALDPLVAFDAAHAGQLMSTLETYLDLNGSVAAVADSLGLHRNSVRYRLGQIVDLTGYDPAITADRVHLWLALTVRRLESEAG
jgi:PucR family transcriptional regulator, purine catabolism regulatory protein